MRNIIVTGGAGFIGSHLCKKILGDAHGCANAGSLPPSMVTATLGHRDRRPELMDRNGDAYDRVIVIDNFNDFYDPEIKRRNINEVQSVSSDVHKLTVCTGDIRDTAFIENVFKTYKADCIIHLAAYAGVRPSIENPALYSDVNVTGTLNLLEMARQHGIRHFIFASSSSVYGNRNQVPFNENDTADFPVSPYAATKRAGELLCHTYHTLYGINIACLRLFTVYGPGQRPDLAVHKFTKLILEGKEIPFYGDGSTSRDYTYIDDIVDGIVKTVDWIQKNKNTYEIFNLGNASPITLNEMVSTIEKVLGIKAKINRLPLQPGDVNITYGDISKASRMLGYNPHTCFESGVSEFVNWYKNNYR